MRTQTITVDITTLATDHAEGPVTIYSNRPTIVVIIPNTNQQLLNVNDIVPQLLPPQNFSILRDNNTDQHVTGEN